jgi:hypothetical protein
MGFLAPPIYLLAVVVLAFGGIPKGMFDPFNEITPETNLYYRLR